jgi:hypothetical protein
MNIRQRITGGFVSVLCLGFLMTATILPAEAGRGSVQLIHGKKSPSREVQPSVPQAGRSLSSPSAFVDRGTPIGERPFAQPFVDRGPSVSERPLAPIGGGAQVVPGAVPFVWCQGEWVRIDNPRHRCPSL